jgi:Protein of unknwon function (DUF3008)
MPATSEKQRRAAAMALAAKHGKLKIKPGGPVKSLMSASDADLRDLARKKKRRKT